MEPTSGVVLCTDSVTILRCKVVIPCSQSHLHISRVRPGKIPGGVSEALRNRQGRECGACGVVFLEQMDAADGTRGFLLIAHAWLRGARFSCIGWLDCPGQDWGSSRVNDGKCVSLVISQSPKYSHILKEFAQMKNSRRISIPQKLRLFSCWYQECIREWFKAWLQMWVMVFHPSRSMDEESTEASTQILATQT